jgi:hypothetical protein
MLFVAVISNKGPHFKLDFQITDNTVIVCSNCVEVHFKAITIRVATRHPENAGCVVDFKMSCLHSQFRTTHKQDSQICLYVTPTLSVCAVVIEYINWKECLIYVVDLTDTYPFEFQYQRCH